MGEKTRTLALCRPCAEIVKGSYILTPKHTGINLKISCAKCRRRRYGAVYFVARKDKTGT